MQPPAELRWLMRLGILSHRALLKVVGVARDSHEPGAGSALCVHAARSEIDTHAGGA